jgi:hypothetical protein
MLLVETHMIKSQNKNLEEIDTMSCIPKNLLVSIA